MSNLMTTCTACSGQVAQAAPTCPHCGLPRIRPANALSGGRERGPTMIPPAVSFAAIGLVLLVVLFAVL